MSGDFHWRSLEELAEGPEARERLREEFPWKLPGGDTPLTRRRLLEFMAASAGLAAAAACRRPLERIIPYQESPERIVPGKPLFYATALPQGRSALGVLAESHMGRPTKVEGLPEHPDGLGATDAFAQAAVRALYDPDRSQAPAREGRVSTWEAFRREADEALGRLKAGDGEGLRVLTGLVTSPTLAEILSSVERRWPRSRWHQYEPAESDNVLEGARLAFGRPLWPRWLLEAADVVVSLESDLLGSGPGWVARARAFAARRRVRGPKDAMSRLYVAESTPTVTGSAADHRLPARSLEVEGLARLLAREAGVAVEAPPLDPRAERWARAAARDLLKSRGRGLLVAGDGQPPVVHALAHAVNARLGNAGRTVAYGPPPEVRPANGVEELAELAEALESGAVELLLVLGANPVYDAPAGLRFAERYAKARLRVHLGLYEDETAALSTWHLPQTHALEAWGDARASNGRVSILQPLIAPLYAGRSALQLAADLFLEGERDAYALISRRWKGLAAGEPEAFWERCVHDGLVPGAAEAAETPAAREAFPPPSPVPRDLELVFRPDPSVHDGRHANNPWLQELPKPASKLTWTNAAFLSPRDAERLRLSNGDFVELALEGRSVEAPVWVLPGQAEGSVAVHLGYGRTRAGRLGTGLGFDAGRLRSPEAMWAARGVTLRALGRNVELPCTQDHHRLHGRDIVRTGTLAEFRAAPASIRGPNPPDASLHPRKEGGEYAWGMTIDLGSCLGCNACVTACQAENNVPTVGPEGVRRGREMHWLRVDRYYRGPAEDPEIVQQPMLCMHCEQAPCEPVCPVGATVHSKEGLNEMVYNRCVGTRYCSNNCPWKVRRFNFFDYVEPAESLKLGRNPDVTVRELGVMEKCTYCVQRISAARIEAKKEGRRIRDGEVVTACQAACPSQAIVFGDIGDPDARVAQEAASPLAYGALEHLGTRPRTRYLAAVKNPNPELKE